MKDFYFLNFFIQSFTLNMTSMAAAKINSGT